MSRKKKSQSVTETRLKREKLLLLEQQRQLQEDLPHLYAHKHYKWSRRFFDSTNKMAFLTAANQCGKSTTQIKKCIHWATSPDLWPKLWPRANRDAMQAWYLYPTRDVSTQEFESKWMPLMPKCVDHPVYGWKLERKMKYVYSLTFNSGFRLFFKHYSQQATDLQAGTCHAIFCDEELPVELLPELQMRLAATNGYFSMVATPTIGQEFWRECLEDGKHFKDALKICVSLYDCLVFEDGSKSHWSKHRIDQLKKACATEQEIDRRIYGKFVVSEDLVFPSFSRDRNLMPKRKIPKDWSIWCGIDPGAGGIKRTSSPSAITFLAVNPGMTEGEVFMTWRGDNEETTSSDLLLKYQEMCNEVGVRPVQTFYDWHKAEFAMVCSRKGVAVTMANKDRDSGFSTINTLFRLGVLRIHEGVYDNDKLVTEILNLRPVKQLKKKDDLVDSTRYVIMGPNWDWTEMPTLKEKLKKKSQKEKSPLEKRRELVMGKSGEAFDEWANDIERDIEELNDLMGV